MRGSGYLLLAAAVITSAANIVFADDQACFPDTEHCRCSKTPSGGICLRPSGTGDDECVEYPCGEGAACDCLTGTKMCAMKTCTGSRYSKKEGAVANAVGVIKCEKVQKSNHCVEMEESVAAGGVCVVDASCDAGLVCNPEKYCALPSRVGGPCTSNASCEKGLACQSHTSTCAKTTSFTLRGAADNFASFQVGLGSGAETLAVPSLGSVYDIPYDGPCGDLFITVNNAGNANNPMSLAIEVQQKVNGVVTNTYPMLPSDDATSPKLTALVKFKPSSTEYKTDASFNFNANGWVPPILAPVGYWGHAPYKTMSGDSKARYLSAYVDPNGMSPAGDYAWKISLPFCNEGF
jgi:hypothetical protein